MAVPAIATAMQGIGAVASGVMAFSAAKGEQERAEINSYIGRTRAIQTDTSARSGMESELATMRSTMAANGQRQGVGTLEVMNSLRGTRGRDRRIEFGNRMQEAADWRLAGKNAKSAATAGLAGGLIKAAPSMFDLYEMKKQGVW